ncbi:MAG: helix-turn-helix transcriptional regulator [Gaiellaceae bacterium]
MSHDTDKLIRQLSLVAFLMAERRPITARDVKQNVEGYSEMSDEAFARRFYADRAELIGLGVPLDSQRDEFTGEELYTLRSERYFLPQLELTDGELAALQTSLYLLEGQFAYAEPLRLALQNLALGRPGFDPPPTETAERVDVRDPDYSPEMPGRLAKLESAISKQRTVRFEYWSINRDEQRERTINPYALLPENGSWYVIGADLDDGRRKKFRVSRVRSDIRLATRRERDFRVPEDFDIDDYRGRANWQVGDLVGEARIEVAGDTAWWVERVYGTAGRLEDGVFVTEYASLPLLASWILRQEGRAAPLEPPKLRTEVERGLKRVAKTHAGRPPAIADELPSDEPQHPERLAGPVAPERFGVLQALLAYLLDRCGDRTEAEIPASELVERFHIPYEALEEHLSLLNLVNFGGGCYAIYAELRGDTVFVLKELFGDTFRAPPRLTPLEARAIRLALDFVGPMIAADTRSPLDNVRAKLEETFGQFDLGGTADSSDSAEELVAILNEGINAHRLVEIEYQKEGEDSPTERVIEPFHIERELPFWYVHAFDRTRSAQRSFRLDRMRSATLTDETFEPRPGSQPERLRGATIARVWYGPEIARWRIERGARPLVDGAALADLPVGSEEWLASEILAARGQAVVLEPENLRRYVAERAQALLVQLTPERAPA